MAQPTILVPNLIQVTEKYIYESRISGVRHTNLTRSTGTIDLAFRYDRREFINSHGLVGNDWWSTTSLAHDLLAMELGHLEIIQYGSSNLNKEPALDWKKNKLPINLDPNSDDLLRPDFQRLNYCDLRLTQTHQPDKPVKVPIRIEVEILDENYFDEQTEASENEEEWLIKELIEQATIKHTLIMRFKILLDLPPHLGVQYKERPPQISRMTLTWPIATPHRLVKLTSGNASAPLIYDPEAGKIEWSNVPLLLQGPIDGLDWYAFNSDWMRLDISEPVEVYHRSDLSGHVEIKVDGPLSELELIYASHNETDVIMPLYRTVLINEFKFKLEEGLGRKHFAPRQHLYFPGVLLDRMRIADIIMLLEDKGFELEERDRNSLKGDPIIDKTSGRKQYLIRAVRDEGAKKLEVVLLIQGSEIGTSRERKISGEAKYTTSLPTGDLRIYIRGKLPGDSKRITTIVNEIQTQLREQFRHVGFAG